MGGHDDSDIVIQQDSRHPKDATCLLADRLAAALRELASECELAAHGNPIARRVLRNHASGRVLQILADLSEFVLRIGQQEGAHS